MKHVIAGIAAGAMMMVGSAAAQPAMPKAVPATVQEQAVVARWIADRAHPFEPGATPTRVHDEVAQALGHADVYGIGEVTHGTHEDQAFKAELIKALVRAGRINLVALESNYSSGVAFDRYVRRGEGDPADLVRSAAFFRIWKGDEFAGLLLWLRAWNLAHPDREVGITAVDLQDPGRDAADALSWLTTRDPALAAAFAQVLRPFGADASGKVPKFITAWLGLGEAEAKHAVSQARAVLDWFERHAAANRDPGFAAAHEGARRTWQGFDSYELARPGAAMDKLPPEFASRRDRHMAANLVRSARGAKGVALWAHDSHVVAEYPQVFVDMGYRTLGRMVRDTPNLTYRTVGFAYTTADVLLTKLARTADAMQSIPPDDKLWSFDLDVPSGIGRLFAAAAAQQRGSDAFWWKVPTAAERDVPAPVLGTDWLLGELGWGFAAEAYPGVIEKTAGSRLSQFDIWVWYHRMTPQRRWPILPSAK